jgi:hypothetical protein
MQRECFATARRQKIDCRERALKLLFAGKDPFRIDGVARIGLCTIQILENDRFPRTPPLAVHKEIARDAHQIAHRFADRLRLFKRKRAGTGILRDVLGVSRSAGTLLLTTNERAASVRHCGSLFRCTLPIVHPVPRLPELSHYPWVGWQGQY